MTFEVTNNGNIPDTFEMSLNLPQGMNAQFTNLVDGQFTPVIDSGASYNVTVEFSFDSGISGNLQMVIIGKSDSIIRLLPVVAQHILLVVLINGLRFYHLNK